MRGGGGGVPFWPDRYEMPGVLYISTFKLDKNSGHQWGSGHPRHQQSASRPAYDPPMGMGMWARACISISEEM